MRQNPTLEYEQNLWNQGLVSVAGVDEVGRGCLAGPIVVGAVIFEPGTRQLNGVRDSKQLTRAQREELVDQIKTQALAYSIGVGSVETINTQGIVSALKVAINSAVNQLTPADQLLIDGRPFTRVEFEWPTTHYIVKGDASVYSIAAASILAKVYRDQVMKELANEFPQFGWERNVGYGTEEHRRALLANGTTPHHRSLFLRKLFK